MAPSTSRSTTKPSRGSHSASQVIHYTGKLHFMTPRDLRRVGASQSFHEFIVAVSREANKFLRPALERALKACAEGENETLKAKRDRKRRIEAGIAELNRKRKRIIAKSKAEYNGFLHRECFGGPPTATGEADDGVSVQATTTLEITPSMANSASNEQGGFSSSEVGDDDASVKDDEDSKESGEPTKYDREMALIRGEPLRLDEDYCRIELAKMHTGSRDSFNANNEFAVLLEFCVMKLDAEVVRDELLEYLRNRLATSTMTHLPIASEDSSIEEILEVLYILNRISADAMIRCAFAQILLFFSVQRRVSRNQRIPEGNHRTAHLNILQDIAAKKAGQVSEKESTRIYKSYEKDYYAGKKWVDIVDMFRDDGIVILFVVAGVGPWYVTNKFTEYQRECLIHISSHLYGIRTLVTVLGQKALERYCRHGYLGEDVVNLVEAVNLLGA